MDPSQVRYGLSPLGDITNTANQVLLDRNEKKRQKAKERYASMSIEQKDEINRKARERRAEKKRRDLERPHGEVETHCMDENAPNETHEQGMDENAPNETHEQGIVEPLGMVSVVDDANERRRQRYASMPQNKKDEINRKRREKRMENKGRVHETANTTGGDHVLNYSWHERDSQQENVTGPRPTHQTFDACTGSDGQLKGKKITTEINNDPFNEESPTTGLREIDGTKGLHSICSQAEKETIIQQATHNQDVDGQLNFRHIQIEDNHSGADHPIIHDLHGGKIKRLTILWVRWCFNSTWFVSIQSFRESKVHFIIPYCHWIIQAHRILHEFLLQKKIKMLNNSVCTQQRSSCTMIILITLLLNAEQLAYMAVIDPNHLSTKT